LAENVYLWSTTASSNDSADSAVPWPENMLPGQVNNSARSTMAGIARFVQDIIGAVTTTGSANAYLATSNSGVTAFTNNQHLTIKANFSNTGAATLNLNSLGAKAIRVFGGTGETDVSGGQIINGGRYQLEYDSSANSAAGAWILLNPATNADIGTIRIWPSDTLPTGWLFCTGASVLRATYPGLFAIIGTTYGTADGTHFNLPDLRGRTPFGSDDMDSSAAGRITNAGSGIVGTTLGASGGAESVTLSTTQIPSHTHPGATSSTTPHLHSVSITSGSGSAHSHTGTTNNGGVDHNHSYTQPNAPVSVYPTNGGGNAVPSTTSVTTGGASAFLHTHTFTTEPESSHTHLVSGTTEPEGAHGHSFTTDPIGGGLLHTNMPPALIVNFIIKAG
jgi:microcystin-dependent protein